MTYRGQSGIRVSRGRVHTGPYALTTCVRIEHRKHKKHSKSLPYTVAQFTFTDVRAPLADNTRDVLGSLLRAKASASANQR